MKRNQQEVSYQCFNLLPKEIYEKIIWLLPIVALHVMRFTCTQLHDIAHSIGSKIHPLVSFQSSYGITKSEYNVHLQAIVFGSVSMIKWSSDIFLSTWLPEELLYVACGVANRLAVDHFKPKAAFSTRILLNCLTMAIFGQDLEIFRFLISEGISEATVKLHADEPNKDWEGLSSLARCLGNVTGKLDQYDSDGITSFYELLLRKANLQMIVDFIQHIALSYLHLIVDCALKYGRVDVMEYLVSVNPIIVKGNRHTYRLNAIKSSNIQMVEWCIKNGLSMEIGHREIEEALGDSPLYFLQWFKEKTGIACTACMTRQMYYQSKFKSLLWAIEQPDSQWSSHVIFCIMRWKHEQLSKALIDTKLYPPNNDNVVRSQRSVSKYDGNLIFIHDIHYIMRKLQ